MGLVCIEVGPYIYFNYPFFSFILVKTLRLLQDSNEMRKDLLSKVSQKNRVISLGANEEVKDLGLEISEL